MAFVRRYADILCAALLLILIAVLLFTLKNPTSLDDGLRHFMMAKALSAQGMTETPGWSQFFYEGWLHAHPVDPWFLSDVLLIPFTAFSLTRGLDLFILCEVLCLFAAFILLLRSVRVPPVPASIFLLLLVFGETQFMGRFLFGRPYALLTAMMLFVIWAIFERRWVMMSLLLAVSVLLSQLFVFPLFMCGAAFLSFLLTQKYKDAIHTGIASALGLLIGFVLHPEPLLYLSYLATVFLRIPFLKSIGLSREMKSGLLYTSGLSVFVILSVIALFAIHLYYRKPKKLTLKNPNLLMLCMAVFFFSAAFLFWLRAIDLLWPLLILLLAFIYALDTSIPRAICRILLPKKTRMTRTLFMCVVFVCSVQMLSLPVIFYRNDSYRSLISFELINRIPSGSRVLNLDWDRFFHYVALRPDLQYAAGIDPTFTYLTDPAVFQDIRSLGQWSDDHKKDDPNPVLMRILDAYPSDYVVMTQQKFKTLLPFFLKNPALTLLEQNEVIAVFAIKNSH